MKFDKLKEERAINTAERIQHAIEIMEAVREGKLKTYNPETHVAVPHDGQPIVCHPMKVKDKPDE